LARVGLPCYVAARGGWPAGGAVTR
jgi:hypothetical protein